MEKGGEGGPSASVLIGSRACLSLVTGAKEAAEPNGKALPSVSKVLVEAVPVWYVAFLY